jgi:2-keto-4-pentenoate hydratase/2-oxohepta-3-ene-1,7-dioic acid hydratase in catechol pathway
LLIEDWETVGERLLPARPEEEVASVEVLAPLRGRDVLCVGKNYKEHAE